MTESPPSPRPGRAAHPPLWLAWAVWGLGALFYLIGFFQRVAPAVLTRELMADFGLAAASLGNLTALYFYSYVAMQIPTGLIADALGPRKLLAGGALLAALGTLLFAVAPGLWLAATGRLLIGGSVAVGWVALLKLASHWFAPRQFGLAAGMALLVGIAGAVGAGVPLRLVVDAFGWRPVMVGAAAITLAMAGAIWWLVRDDPAQRGYQSHATAQAPAIGAGHAPLAGMAQVLKTRNVLLLFLAPGGVVGPVFTFAGLWGVPYLRLSHGLDEAGAAALCSLFMMAWALGGPLLGGLSDRLGRRKPLYLAGNLVCLAGWAAVILLPGLPLWAMAACLLLTGLASGGMIIGFAFAKESVPARLAGTVSGVVNMGVMLGPAMLQPLVGLLLDLAWDGAMAGGLRLYSLDAFRLAFSLMLLWSAAACLLVALTRETHGRPHGE